MLNFSQCNYWICKWFRFFKDYYNCQCTKKIIFFSVLQDSMSSTYEDEGPYPWYRTEMAIYYIVYFVVFPFFFVNIFVALVIVTFNELGEAELTDNIDKNQVRHFKPDLLIYFLVSFCSPIWENWAMPDTWIAIFSCFKLSY